MPKHSKQLAALVHHNNGVVQEYNFHIDEDVPHWLYFHNGWQVDGCHQCNGTTVAECLDEYNRASPCSCDDCQPPVETDTEQATRQAGQRGGRRTAGPGKSIGRPPAANPKQSLTVRLAPAVRDFLLRDGNASAAVALLVAESDAWKQQQANVMAAANRRNLVAFHDGLAGSPVPRLALPVQLDAINVPEAGQ